MKNIKCTCDCSKNHPSCPRYGTAIKHGSCTIQFRDDGTFDIQFYTKNWDVCLGTRSGNYKLIESNDSHDKYNLFDDSSVRCTFLKNSNQLSVESDKYEECDVSECTNGVYIKYYTYEYI